MPNKELENFRVPRKKGKDRRIKLTEQERENVRIEYATTDTSTRKLAKKYSVSRRLIQFIIDPSKYEHARKIRKENGKKNNHYYDKEKHRKYMLDHRRHKKELMNSTEEDK